MARDTTKETAPPPEAPAGEPDKGLVEVEFMRRYFIGKNTLVQPGERAFVRREQLKAIEGGKPPYGKRVK